MISPTGYDNFVGAIHRECGCPILKFLVLYIKSISYLQMTLDAIGLVEIGDDVVWNDISEFLATVGDSGSKKALLNFVAVRVGLFGEDDGDRWWEL